MGILFFLASGILGLQLLLLVALFLADAVPHRKYLRAFKRLLLFVIVCELALILLHEFALKFVLAVPILFALFLAVQQLRKRA